MTKDDDILFNFKSCFTSLLINAEIDFKTSSEKNLLSNMESFVQKDLNENLSNRTLQILQSEHRKGNEHFLRTFRGEMVEIYERFERIKKDNKGNVLLNQLSISLDGFTVVWEFLAGALNIYILGGVKKHIVERSQLRDPFRDEYDGLFCVSKEKVNLKLPNGNIQHTYHSTKGSFDIENQNLYDYKTGELLKVETQVTYQSAFVMKLARISNLEIKNFLSYHFENSKFPDRYYDFINYSVLDLPLIKSEGKKRAIRDWLDVQKQNRFTSEAEPSRQHESPKFSEMFYEPGIAEVCLEVLRELQSPAIDAANNYIGKAKGVFPLWVKVLKNHKPRPLIKPFKDAVYKDVLNEKIKGLKLSKDASEFRKEYRRLEKNNVEQEMKLILSQYSQSGKLGK